MRLVMSRVQFSSSLQIIFGTRILLSGFLVILPLSVTLGQMVEPRLGTMYYPTRLNVGELKHALGITLARPPDQVVEEFAAVFTVPLLEYQLMYGLAENVQVEGRATTIFTANHLCGGAKWIFGRSRLQFSLGLDLAFWFGALDTGGFDNTVAGWTLYPNFSMGHDFGPFAITLKFELNMLLAHNKRTGGVTIQKAFSTFNGGAVTIYLEQPLWKDNHVAFGVKSNFLKYYYVAWPGFPTFEEFSYIPEFYMGLIL